MSKRWKFLQCDPEMQTSLSAQLNIHPVLSRLLLQRGIQTFEEARDFFRPSLQKLHDPFLMKDMDRAVERISRALSAGEKILVYGDYDVDGTTSVAMMFSFLQQLTPQVDYYIPNRYTEGYGVSFQGIDFAEKEGFSLIISLDCGIKSADKVQYALEKQIDFVICDHHMPDITLPAAAAVLDPKRTDCLYPYKELSGCGVGFKLIQALCSSLKLPEDTAYAWLDLICTSIAADIVPITGENRILAFHGLKKLIQQPTPGLKTLLAAAGLKRDPDITDVVFILAPRINAAGRMEDARHAVRLLIGAEPGLMEQYADRLNDFNRDRKDLDRAITQQALQRIQDDPALQNKRSTVLWQADWHKGVLGIVASRLTETWYRPTIVLTESEGKLMGSARSIRDFDLYEALYACREHLTQFGGHKFAAGLSLPVENVEAFQQQFEAVVRARTTDDMFIPEIEVDAELPTEAISKSFYSIVQQLAPFGPGNMKPQFVSRGLVDTGYSRLLKNQHLKLSVKNATGKTFDGIAFGQPTWLEVVKQGPVDVLYQLEENEWNGQVNLQWMIKDIRPSA
jgi:single-stranded-DNA-specific exonuclease